MRPPSPLDHTEHVRFRSLASWIRAAAGCQINIAALLREAGLSEALERDPTPPIRVDHLAELMVRCTDLAWPRWYFPIKVGEQFAFDQLPAFETFLTTAATPRDALAALQWVGQVFPHMRVWLEEAGDEAALLVDTTVTLPDPRGRACLIEKDLATIQRVARAMLGADVSGHGIDLQHQPAPAVLACLQAHYGLPVQGGQPRNAVRFPRRLLDTPMCGALPALNRHARDLVEQQLPPAPGASVTETLMTWFRQEPGLLDAPLDDLAGRLLLHPRTLQRRLDEAGIRFAQLRDDCRRQMAFDALTAPDAPRLDDVAARLGFADRNSFSRAFRRWTGVTPAAWRRQQACAQG